MICVEHATAKRLERAGIGMRELSAAISAISSTRKWARRLGMIRRLELAVGGPLSIAYRNGGRISELSFGCDFPHMGDALVFGTLHLNDQLSWELDSVCGMPGDLPITLVQGVDGLPLLSVVDHPDLPDAPLRTEREEVSTKALIGIAETVAIALPVPTRRDASLQRRAMRRFLRRERIEAIPRDFRRRTAILSILAFGSIGVLTLLAIYSKSGTLVHNGFVAETSLAVALAVPILSTWNVIEGNPLLHRLFTLPAVEARHKAEMRNERAKRIGTRGTARWTTPTGETIL